MMKSCLSIIAVGVFALFSCWWVTDSIWSSKYADLESDFSDYREQRSQAEIDLKAKHKADLERMQSAKAELDEKHFKELMDVQGNIDGLLDGVGSGDVGVFVRAETNSGDRGSEKDSTAASMDDGKALVRLSREDAKAIFSIAGYGDETAIILTGLQAYVDDVCLGGADDR